MAGSHIIGRLKLWDGVDEATISDEGYLNVATNSNHSGTSISFGADSVAATVGYVLVDLSDATNYPHTGTTAIHIDWIALDYLASSDAVGSIEVGFIKSITADNADWYAVAKAILDKKETEHPIQINFNPQHVICTTAGYLAGGTMFHDNDTTFQNDTAITATYGTVIPAVEDLICKVTLSAGTVSFAVSVGYHGYA